MGDAVAFWAIGLGANVGAREEQVGRLGRAVRDLLRRLSNQGGRLVAASPIYQTAPWGRTDQAVFLNAAVTLETHPSLSPPQLLALCKAVETDLGRMVRERWGPRELDLDILLMAPGEYSGPGLVVPHRDLIGRAFALAPARDAGWSHAPAVGQTPGWKLAVSDGVAATRADSDTVPTVTGALKTLENSGGDTGLVLVVNPEDWLGDLLPASPAGPQWAPPPA